MGGLHFVSLEAIGGFRPALDRDESFRWLLQTSISGLHALCERERDHYDLSKIRGVFP